MKYGWCATRHDALTLRSYSGSLHDRQGAPPAQIIDSHEQRSVPKEREAVRTDNEWTSAQVPK
jgi:hypothetical protein